MHTRMLFSSKRNKWLSQAGEKTPPGFHWTRKETERGTLAPPVIQQVPGCFLVWLLDIAHVTL